MNVRARRDTNFPTMMIAEKMADAIQREFCTGDAKAN